MLAFQLEHDNKCMSPAEQRQRCQLGEKTTPTQKIRTKNFLEQKTF